jgi:aryl-alcohol dehydrogenase-like predicted oxidoreductase
MQTRPLGNSGLSVTPIALGCWPIAGMTSPDVNDTDSLATITACFDLGINFLDTAYCYGAHGESERLIARALGSRRHEMVIATKGGIEWGPDRKQVIDGRPATIRRHCEESLRRLQTDRVELLYLHAPDPHTPITETAAEFKRLLDEGKTRAVGVSNVSLAQLEAFQSVCPLSAYQPPYNMLQREIELDTLPWCVAHNVAVVIYWPLLKGLLAGKLQRDHVFAEGDSRRKYPMFQGDEWQRNHDLVDDLRTIAAKTGHSVAQLVINWTIRQPGITVALCGAKRPDQIIDNAGGAGWELTAAQLQQIDSALTRRGKAATRRPV